MIFGIVFVIPIPDVNWSERCKILASHGNPQHDLP